jgi:hypothetical protein
MDGATSSNGRSPKVIRSYRLVFHRHWRIFRIQNWRIPLPGGLELRAVGYWLACLAAVVVLARLPGVGVLLGLLPSSLRFALLPLAGAWALSSWEIDGRSPHRALAGILAWRVRPRALAGLRHCPAVGAEGPSVGPIRIAADLSGASYPRGRLRGPARVLLRYPVCVKAEGAPRAAGLSREERIAQARRWRLRASGAGALRRGRVLEVPAGREVIFE